MTALLAKAGRWGGTRPKLSYCPINILLIVFLFLFYSVSGKHFFTADVGGVSQMAGVSAQLGEFHQLPKKGGEELY